MVPPIQPVLDHFHTELQGIRSGRATPALVENDPIEVYGSTMKLLELAAITAPEPRQLVVQPWDRNTLKDIERGVRLAHPDLNPVVDGDRIRILLPSLTEERRKEYLHLAGEQAELSRRTLRGLRDAAMKDLKERERLGKLSEDVADRERQTIEDAMKKATEQIATMLHDKERELMTV